MNDIGTIVVHLAKINSNSYCTQNLGLIKVLNSMYLYRRDRERKEGRKGRGRERFRI